MAIGDDHLLRSRAVKTKTKLDEFRQKGIPIVPNYVIGEAMPRWRPNSYVKKFVTAPTAKCQLILSPPTWLVEVFTAAGTKELSPDLMSSSTDILALVYMLHPNPKLGTQCIVVDLDVSTWRWVPHDSWGSWPKKTQMIPLGYAVSWDLTVQDAKAIKRFLNKYLKRMLNDLTEEER